MIYQQENIGLNTFKRTFNESVESSELKWHKDQYDRTVLVQKSNGWKLQMDEKLPINLKEGKKYFIPKETFHRVIKGKDELIVVINENKEEFSENNIIKVPTNVLSNMKKGYSYLNKKKNKSIFNILKNETATVSELKQLKHYFDSKKTNLIKESNVQTQEELEHLLYGGNTGYLWLISLFG